MVEAGAKGRKSGSGFYHYEDGKKKEVNEDAYRFFDAAAQSDIPEDVIERRLVLSFVNEAIYCLQDGILESARDGDIGAVFGLGFPPFLGGPFRYVDNRGARSVLRKLDELRDKRGAQFSPSELLRRHADEELAFTQ